MTEPTFKAPQELVSALEKNPKTNIGLPIQHVPVGEAAYPTDVFDRLLALDLLYVHRNT